MLLNPSKSNEHHKKEQSINSMSCDINYATVNELSKMIQEILSVDQSVLRAISCELSDIA